MTEFDPAAAAADVIMTLIYHEVIINNRPTITRIERLTGVTRGDLEASRLRLAKLSYGPFDIHRTEYQAEIKERIPSARKAESHSTVPRPAGMAKAKHERERRVNGDGVTELYCTGHDGHESHWAPEDNFLRRADRPHLRVSRCDEGRKSYQRSRRVTVKALEEINSAGFALKLDELSNLVGIACKDCGQPFAPGDSVEGDAVMRHVLCEVPS